MDRTIQTYAGRCSVKTILNHSNYLILLINTGLIHQTILYTQRTTRMSAYGTLPLYGIANIMPQSGRLRSTEFSMFGLTVMTLDIRNDLNA